jgi:hypothetical protein
MMKHDLHLAIHQSSINSAVSQTCWGLSECESIGYSVMTAVGKIQDFGQ